MVKPGKLLVAHTWQTGFFLIIVFAAYMFTRELVRNFRPSGTPCDNWYLHDNQDRRIIIIAGEAGSLTFEDVRFEMEYDALILGLMLYLLLIGVLVLLNEAFCKTICLKNARVARLQLETPDVELNERRPSKTQKEPIVYQPTSNAPFRQSYK